MMSTHNFIRLFIIFVIVVIVIVVIIVIITLSSSENQPNPYDEHTKVDSHHEGDGCHDNALAVLKVSEQYFMLFEA